MTSDSSAEGDRRECFVSGCDDPVTTIVYAGVKPRVSCDEHVKTLKDVGAIDD